MLARRVDLDEPIDYRNDDPDYYNEVTCERLEKYMASLQSMKADLEHMSVEPIMDLAQFRSREHNRREPVPPFLLRLQKLKVNKTPSMPRRRSRMRNSPSVPSISTFGTRPNLKTAAAGSRMALTQGNGVFSQVGLSARIAAILPKLHYDGGRRLRERKSSVPPAAKYHIAADPRSNNMPPQPADRSDMGLIRMRTGGFREEMRRVAREERPRVFQKHRITAGLPLL